MSGALLPPAGRGADTDPETTTREHTMATQAHAGHDDVRASRFITGAVLLAGFAILGLGLGLLVTDPGSGLIIGVGLGLAAIGLIRASREA
jgi:hypothetical protein